MASSLTEKTRSHAWRKLMIDEQYKQNGQPSVQESDQLFSGVGNSIFDLIEKLQLDEAVRLLQNTTQCAPSSLAILWHSVGRGFEKSGRVLDAEISYSRAVELDPSCAKAWNDLGVTLAMQAKDSQAEVAFKRSIELDGGYRNPHLNLRDLELRKDKRPTSGSDDVSNFEETRLVKQLKNDPQNAELWLNVAREQAAQAKIEQAKRSARKAIRYSPELLPAWFLLLKLHKDKGDQRGLSNALNLFKASRPNAAEAWLLMGDLFKGLRQSNEVTECYRCAVQMDPESHACWETWASWLGETGDEAGSIRAMNHAMKLNPSNSGGWNKLGISLYRLGDYSDAHNCFGIAVHANGKNVEAWVWLAKSLEKLNDLESAEKVLFKLLEMEPGEARGWNHLGVLYAIKSDHESAEKCFKKALELAPNYPNPWYNLRDVYIQSGDQTAAKSALAAASAIAPSNAVTFESDG